MQLILVRHGESIGNIEGVIYGHTDYPLTTRGIEQTQCILDALSSIPINKLYCSPLKRTMKIGELIKKERQIDLYLEPRIMEMNYGVLEGKTVQEAMDNYTEIYNNYMSYYETYLIPDGETYTAFKERILTFINELDQTEQLCVISHGGVIREILVYLLKIDYELVWKLPLHPGSIIFLSKMDRAWRLDKIENID